MPETNQPPNESPGQSVRRAEDFRSYYANNVLIQSSAWDVTLTFGQFDQSGSAQANVVKVSVTIPFGVAKIGMYWLQAHLLANEIDNGQKIALRQNVLPPPPEDLPPEQANDPVARRYHAALKQLYDAFMATLRQP